MSHKFEIEYAKSGRASCKKCGGKIDKDELRIGHSQDIPAGDDGVKNYSLMGTKWYHVSCFPTFKGAKWLKTNLCQFQDVTGLHSLKPDDQQKIRLLWTAIQGEGGATGGASGTTGGAASGAAASLSSIIEEKQGILSDSQFSLFKQYKQELLKKSVAQLKDMCSINKLPKSGSKNDLIELVAETRALGGPLPICSACEKGKLKFNRMNGVIKCSGYYDDAIGRFTSCKGPGEEILKSIRRIKWKLDEEERDVYIENRTNGSGSGAATGAQAAAVAQRPQIRSSPGGPASSDVPAAKRQRIENSNPKSVSSTTVNTSSNTVNTGSTSSNTKSPMKSSNTPGNQGQGQNQTAKINANFNNMAALGGPFGSSNFNLGNGTNFGSFGMPMGTGSGSALSPMKK